MTAHSFADPCAPPCHYCADHGEYGVPATQRVPYGQWGVEIGAYVCDGCAAILKGTSCPTS
jgi:hypothetical protein